MNRLTLCSVVSVLLLLSPSASAVTVDLVDFPGTLDWNTSQSVTLPFPNTSVTHPLFANNRHTHEGWFLYVEDTGELHEFTNFTKTVNGDSQDVLTETFMSLIAEPFTLELTYGITAFGPDGLPDLGWSGEISRPFSLTPTLEVMDVRLFNVWDYDIGDVSVVDSATATVFGAPAVLVEIEGLGGITGYRGATGTDHYTVDTLSNVLGQIFLTDDLNDVAAAGNYDVAGAFHWDWSLCANALTPECSGFGGPGTGGFGGFGGFGPSSGAPVPEPSTTLLLLGGLVVALRSKRAAPRSRIA